MSLLSLLIPTRLLAGLLLFASASLFLWSFIFSPESVNEGRPFSFNDGEGILFMYAVALFFLLPTLRKIKKAWQNRADARIKKTGFATSGILVDIAKTGRLTLNMIAEHTLVVRVIDPNGFEKELRSRPFKFVEHAEIISAIKAKKISVNVFFDRLDPEIYVVDTTGFDHEIFSIFQRVPSGGPIRLD